MFENDMSFEVLSRVTQGLNQSPHDSSSEPRMSWSFIYFHPQLTCIQRNIHGVYTLLVFRRQGSLGSITVTSLSPGFLVHFFPHLFFTFPSSFLLHDCLLYWSFNMKINHLNSLLEASRIRINKLQLR